jgi:vancomycin resistance protein YoaR
VGDTTYTTTAGEIGLEVDKDRTTEAALDVGRGTPFPLRPFEWARSLFATRNAPVHVQVNPDQVTATVIDLEGEKRSLPVEPTVELVDGTFHVVPGVDGTGLDPEAVAELLSRSAERAVANAAEVVHIDAEQTPIAPLGSEAAAEEAAADAEALVDEPIEVGTARGVRTISSDQLRQWVRLQSNPDGTVVVSFDGGAAAADLRRAFADVEGHPIDASFTLEGGVPVIRPDQPGLVCCDGDPSAAILNSLQSGDRSVEVSLVEGAAGFTTADAEAYGITQPVGGNHAWRDGAPTTAGPGFTTYHAPSGARITNIHRIADLVRGVVIAPGASFSINDHVGRRTAENGFVSAGAISNGEHVDEIGGGISQFATTTINAAYFAGLQIDEYQAHSEYFSRYPRGREATMGFPAPDLVFTNNTPYGIMIWTSYTQSSLTVTLYSTPYGTAEQTASVDGTAGRCTTVTTTRTTTYPDGHQEQDKFTARYRPSGSTTC